MSEEIVVQNQSIKEIFNTPDIAKRFELVLWKNAQGYMSNVLSIVNKDSQLSKADPTSVFNVAIESASMGLSLNPNLWQAYIIWYNLKQTDWSYKVVAQFQMWYKGFKQLALRSQEFKLMNESDVREWEIKTNNRLTWQIEFERIENEEIRNKKPIIWYVSYFELKSWFSNQLYMTVADLEKHGRKYSQTYKKYGTWLWKDDFDWMCKKTVAKLNLSKNAPLSIELQKAIMLDQGTIWEDDEIEYPDWVNTKPTAENTIDWDLLQKWIDDLNHCNTIEEINKLYDDRKPSDPSILSLFTARKNELNNTTIQD